MGGKGEKFLFLVSAPMDLLRQLSESLTVRFGSSLSGTGGPLLLIPSLLLLNFPVMVAVGLSMAIQIPIAPFATLGHVLQWF